MNKLHIGNTNFEWELEHNPTLSLEKSFEIHRNFVQLQFLPLLYGEKQDFIFTTHFPSEKYLKKLYQIGFTPPTIIGKEGLKQNFFIDSWGASTLIEQFAEKHHLYYQAPDLKIVKRFSSKEFSFSISPLEGGAIIKNLPDLKDWIVKTKGKKVLKSPFGFSGKGHFFIENDLSTSEEILPSIETFAINEFKHQRAIIAEPWMERLLDFSTQWEITNNGHIHYLGATFLQTSKRGGHHGNIAGEEKELFANYYSLFEEHITFVKPILHQMSLKGYFGNIGLDAMVYFHKQKIKLQPLVEINPRKTFGFLTLFLRKKFQQKFLVLRYVNQKKSKNISLLPSFVDDLQFLKQLEMELDLQRVLH